MLRDKATIGNAFQEIAAKSWETCENELERIRQLILLIPRFETTMREYRNKEPEICFNSLVDACYVECARISGHILFLTSNALYKNAYDDIRYLLESIVQSFYLDTGHKDSDLKTKIEIWKEIEGRREYRAQNLIGKLDLGAQAEQKAKLEKEYSTLSQRIHFSHKQVLVTLKDLQSDVDQGIPAKIDCNEVENVFNSTKTAYDIFFLLIIITFPQIRGMLEKNSSFIEHIQKFRIPLLCKVFGLSC